jgi:hypothetical protein
MAQSPDHGLILSLIMTTAFGVIVLRVETGIIIKMTQVLIINYSPRLTLIQGRLLTTTLWASLKISG